MPALQRGNYPSPSVKWGQNLANESVKGLPSAQVGAIKTYLKSQTPAGNLPGDQLKTASQNIILNEDTLTHFLKEVLCSK